MSDQAQCPNCGGYKVVTEKSEVINSTEKLPISFGKWTLQMILAIALLGGMGLFCSMTIGAAGSNLGLIPLGLTGLLIVLLLMLFPRAAQQASEGKLTTSKTRKVGTMYHLYCQICGYKFDWDNRTPWPRVQTNPDLLAKGAARLEVEEAERRRQQEAALYYLSQQNKK